MSPNNGPRRTSVEPIPKTLSTMSLPISTPENSVGSRSSSPFKFQGLFVKEEKSDVRKRSEQLLRLLHAEAEWKHHESIAIVTHKGYLREFERGPLGRPDAEEFGNCEVRVFRSSWARRGTITSLSRVFVRRSRERVATRLSIRSRRKRLSRHGHG